MRLNVRDAADLRRSRHKVTCPCGRGPSPLWSPVTVDKTSDTDPERDGMLLRSMWCKTHGLEYCAAVMAGDTAPGGYQGGGRVGQENGHGRQPPGQGGDGTADPAQPPTAAWEAEEPP